MSTLQLRNLATLFIEPRLTDEMTFDIIIEEFANKKARKVSMQKIVVFISEIKMVLLFYTFFYNFSLYFILLFV